MWASGRVCVRWRAGGVLAAAWLVGTLVLAYGTPGAGAGAGLQAGETSAGPDGSGVHVWPPAPLRAQPVPDALGPVTDTVYLPVVYQGHRPYGPLPFGLQVYGVEPDTTARAVGAGAAWVRMPLSWAAIEPSNTTPDKYTWYPTWEAELASYAGQGVRVILTLTNNPQWAADFPAGPVHSHDVVELVEFLQTVVGRYGIAPYNVKHWEMYNEPDNGDPGYAAVGWGYFGDDPQAYVDLLEAVYQPVKDVDPEAQVLFGGMAYDNWEPYGPFVQSFLDDVLGIMEANGSYPFDLMNFHYYPLFSDNWAEYGIDIIGKVVFIQDKLASYKADKPLVCTESGLWSDCPDPEDEKLCSSYEEQSRYVAQVYARGEAAGLETNIWFMLVDPDNDVDLKSGLLDVNLVPKLSYTAYRALAEQLTFTHYIRTLEPDETGSDQIEAYEFVVGEGPGRIVVAWTDDDLNHSLALGGSCLTMVDKYGLASGPICDAADGLVDGVIHVDIGPSPVYLHLP